MPADKIIKASAVITFDPVNSRAEALAIESATGRIVHVGTAAECASIAGADAQVEDLGSSVIIPGLIDPHSHPVLSGLVMMEPVYWIAPYSGKYPDWAAVQAKFKEVDASTPAGQPVLFNGLDRLLQQAPELDNKTLDEFFPNRPAVVIDNSGHEVYFNTKNMEFLGWVDGKAPADPVGGRYGRNPDGSSNGRAYETAAIIGAAMKALGVCVPHPLKSVAKFGKFMADNGITACSEHTYQANMEKAYVAITSVPDAPQRVALYHMSIEKDCADKLTFPVPEEKLWKQGIKLWADGSPWVGTMASSFPYNDHPRVRQAEIPLGPMGTKNMNYTREELDQILDKNVASGFQFAFHVNGDVGLDIVLDAYEAALVRHKLMGTKHGWRVEHCGGCRGDQFKRAAELGVAVSLGAFQFVYWGDLLDGIMFPSEIGSQWIQAGSAFAGGASVSFHNDGSVSPPIPLLNIQAMTTRRCFSGNVHGTNQAISLDNAFRAHTINAAEHIGRAKDLGSLEKGKLADLCVLSADPFAVDAAKIVELCKVQGTYLGGRKVDTDAYLKQIDAIDPSQHKSLLEHATTRRCSC